MSAALLSICAPATPHTHARVFHSPRRGVPLSLLARGVRIEHGCAWPVDPISPISQAVSPATDGCFMFVGWACAHGAG